MSDYTFLLTDAPGIVVRVGVGLLGGLNLNRKPGGALRRVRPLQESVPTRLLDRDFRGLRRERGHV